MKILFVRGNPRPNGVCALLGGRFLEGLQAAGAQVLDFDLREKKVGDCCGCFVCSVGFDRRGKCVQTDDMAQALDFLDSADALVCLTPVYFYSMSAQLKRFFDRCFPFVRGYEFDESDGKMRNATQFLEPRKKFVSIGVSSGLSEDVFGGLTATFATIADSMNFEYSANITRGESAYFLVDNRSVRVRRVAEAFSRAGREFAETGAITPETLAETVAPFSRGKKSFAANAQVFWKLRHSGRI